MTAWLDIDGEGLLVAERIVAVGWAEAAPVRRLIRETPTSHLLILTGGRKRQTVIVLDSGHVVITPLTMAEFIELGIKGVTHVP